MKTVVIKINNGRALKIKKNVVNYLRKIKKDIFMRK
jgi:hypothetical protein